jgi:hypothetical protein
MLITSKSLGHLCSDYPHGGPEHSVGADKMSVPISMWIALGVVVTLGLSASISLALGTILGSIGREVNELLEAESWTTLPPARARALARG